jgi:hypothetical protein
MLELKNQYFCGITLKELRDFEIDSCSSAQVPDTWLSLIMSLLLTRPKKPDVTDEDRRI